LLILFQRRGFESDYGSEFEYDSETERKKARRHDLASKAPVVKESRPLKTEFVEERSRDEWRYQRHHLISTNAVSS